MNSADTGKAIADLRKKAGYTQAALAEALEVSDKAVSKWERGIACPDILLLPKLSVLLDTDIEGLIRGDNVERGDRWKGILVLDELASVQVYSKPLVYYLLQNFFLVGIRDILIIGGNIKRLLGTGEQYGVSFTYSDEPFTDSLLKNIKFTIAKTMVVFSNVLVYGANLTRKYQSIMFHPERAVVMKSHSGIQLPIIFIPEGEWEKVHFMMKYWKNIDDMIEDIKPVEKAFTRGIVALPINNRDQLLSACCFVQIIEKSEKREIANLQEIASNRGFYHSTTNTSK